MSIAEPMTECDIFGRIVRSSELKWSQAEALAILQLDFAQQDRQRMHALLAKNREDALTDAEQRQMESFRNVGLMLDILHSKVSLTLGNCERQN